MKKKLTIFSFAFALACIILGFSSGSAFAATYDPSGDSTLNVSTPSSLTSALNPLFQTTSTATFGTQELVQNTVTNTTGLQITHSYAWVDVNGQSVAAVDPPRLMFGF